MGTYFCASIPHKAKSLFLPFFCLCICLSVVFCSIADWSWQGEMATPDLSRREGTKKGSTVPRDLLTYPQPLCWPRSRNGSRTGKLMEKGTLPITDGIGSREWWYNMGKDIFWQENVCQVQIYLRGDDGLHCRVLIIK